MEDLKLVKFKKPLELFVSGGFVSNRHWVLKTAWLLNLPRKRANGLMGLQTRVKNHQAQAVLGRLNGTYSAPHDIEAMIQRIDLKQYKAPQKTARTLYSYIRGNYLKPGPVAVQVGGVKGPYLDVEYFVATLFDSATQVLIHKTDKAAPLVIVNNSNEIVGVVACLNPKQFEGKNS